MKHNVGIVLLSIVFVLLLSFALADDTVTAMYFDDYSYVYLDDGSICITEYTGNSKKVSVPAQIDGKPVTQIGTLAFAEYETSNITAVTLPDTIVRIKSLAFSGCT